MAFRRRCCWRPTDWKTRPSQTGRPQKTQRECAVRPGCSSQGTGWRSAPHDGHESPPAYSAPQRVQANVCSGVSTDKACSLRVGAERTASFFA